MSLIYVPLCGIVLVTAIAYQLSCPDKLQRHLRGQNCTVRGIHYICLFNILDNINVENCVSEDYKFHSGFRKIRKPGITNGNCTVDRYQPIIFSTDKFSDCMYTKSRCEEEGQMVASNRTGYQDRTCRCDYRAGYSYIIQPKNPCACIPSEEDCSCMRKYCGGNETLSTDYRCVPANKLTLTACSKISFPLPPGTTSPPPGITSLQQEQFSTFTESIGVNASVAIVLIMIVGMVVVILLKLRVFPELTSCMIIIEDKSLEIYGDKKTRTYIGIQGCSAKVVSKYKSLLPCEDILIKDVSTGLMLEGVMEKVKIVKRICKPWGIMTAVERHLSFVVPSLNLNKGRKYEIVLKNKLYLPHTLMERWKRFHASLVNLIYKKECGKDDSSSCTFEFIMHSIPEKYEAVDVFYGKKIELKIDRAAKMLRHANIQKVLWFKLDEVQLKVVETEKTEDQGEQKYLSGDKNDKSLIKNHTCMRDAGRYVCFVQLDKGEVTSYGWEMRVIPQESAYNQLKQHRLEKSYIAVSVLSDATKSLEKNGVVVLKGREGTGKTEISLELASFLEEKGYLPVIVKSAEDIFVEFDELKILYIFDESNDLPSYWIDQLKRFLSNIISQRLSCKAVFTCRSVQLLNLKDCKVIKEMTVDLDNTLTADEKSNILNHYMKKHGIAIVPSKERNDSIEVMKDKTKPCKLDYDSVRMVIQTEPLQGFPLMAKQFCEVRHNLHLGEKYFKIPPNAVIEKIKKMKEEASACASNHEILRFVTLMYITFSENHKLDTLDLNYKKFIECYSMRLSRSVSIKLPAVANDQLTEDIKVAANSLVGDYLTRSDDGFRFIHPYYHKAVLLSSVDFAPYIIQHKSVEMIIECIRGTNYINQEGETVLKIPEDCLHMLCERLVNEFTQNTAAFKKGKTATDICNYIYNDWIRSKDLKFCRHLFDYLETQIPLHKETKKGVVKVKVQLRQVLFFIRHLTCDWTDLWICSSDVIHDIVVIIGLLSLCLVISEKKQKQELSKSAGDGKIHEAVEILLGNFGKASSYTEDSKEERLSWKLGASLDRYGNTFFHYLVLFNENTACKILECCCKHFKQEWTVTNDFGFRPIDMAVAMGNPKLYKILVQAYKDIRYKVTKDDWMKINTKRLRNILAAARNPSHDRKTEPTEKPFDVKENFDDEIYRFVLTGSEEDYKQLHQILQD